MINNLIDKTLLKVYDKKLKTMASLLQRSYEYNIGDVVTCKGITLKCTQAGTTNTADIANLDSVKVGDYITDGTLTWLVIDPSGASGISNWQANKPYAVNDVVIYNNKIYKCNKAHTSTTDFGADKPRYWNSLNDSPIINDWISGNNYEVGSMVIISNANNISEWTTNTSYNVNDEVIYNGYVYMCKTVNTDATFTESNWTIKEPVYNRMYRCIKENKDTTFTEANWQLINGDSVAKESDVEDLLL